jgi:alanyl-tRNA synthetase
VKQKGSNITAERLRIDFNYNVKMTEEEIRKVEDIVNEQIDRGLDVKRVDLQKAIAEKVGAEMEFGQKYPDIVSVYFIGLKDGVEPQNASSGDYFSAEFCGGPHVRNTREIGRFRIIKEESSGAGVRRVKGVIE